jgi:hypothetical protein
MEAVSEDLAAVDEVMAWTQWRWRWHYVGWWCGPDDGGGGMALRHMLRRSGRAA